MGIWKQHIQCTNKCRWSSTTTTNIRRRKSIKNNCNKRRILFRICNNIRRKSSNLGIKQLCTISNRRQNNKNTCNIYERQRRTRLYRRNDNIRRNIQYRNCKKWRNSMEYRIQWIWRIRWWLNKLNKLLRININTIYRISRKRSNTKTIKSNISNTTKNNIWI